MTVRYPSWCTVTLSSWVSFQGGTRRSAAGAVGCWGPTVLAMPRAVAVLGTRTATSCLHVAGEVVAMLVTSAADVTALLSLLRTQEEFPLRGEARPIDSLPALLRSVREVIPVAGTSGVAEADSRHRDDSSPCLRRHGAQYQVP